MRPSLEHKPVSPEAMALGYEPASIRVRGLVVFIVLTAVFAVGLHALLWWTMKRIEWNAAEIDVPRSALRGDTAPPPNLQPSVEHDVTDAHDLEAMHQQEDAVFSRLGWNVKPGTHDVEIPASIVQSVAQRQRNAGPEVPPTTTGKNFNSTSVNGGAK